MALTDMTGTGPRRPQPTSIGTVLRWVVAATMLGSGAIHFAMMGEHAGVSWTHGLFFATAGWLQLALAAMIGFRPTRPVVTIGIVVNLGLLTVWVLTRTVGIAIGGDGTPEAWGRVDILCAVFEGIAVLASAGLLSKSFARRPLSAGVGFAGIGVLVVAVAVLTSLVFSPAATKVTAGASADGHNHGGGSEPAGHVHSAPVGPAGLVDTGFGFIVTGALTGDSPCEKSGPPASEGQTGKDAEGHSHRGPFKQDPLTEAEQVQLEAQQTQARAVALKYPNVAAAEAAGYRESTVYVPCIGAHYTNTGLAGRFDPSAPSELLFDGTTPDAKIVGLSYLVFHLNGPPEGFAGPNDRWHQHNLNGGLCLKGGQVVGAESTSAAECKARGGAKVPLDDIWMVHDWIVPGWECSWGVFAGECPELGGRTGGTAFDEPDPRLAGKVTDGRTQAAGK
jgi:hypothetical protein